VETTLSASGARAQERTKRFFSDSPLTPSTPCVSYTAIKVNNNSGNTEDTVRPIFAFEAFRHPKEGIAGRGELDYQLKKSVEIRWPGLWIGQ
jgi:hypothetical protein